MFAVVHRLLDNWTSSNKDAILKKIDSVEYISFDIFDTLLKRDLKEPGDIFSVVEKKTGRKNFYIDRVNAEMRARQNINKTEINLEDIYFYIDGSKEEKNCLMQTELECELEFTSVNYEILELYKYCIENKKVVLTSDMYLPRGIVLKLLNKNNITGFQKLYLSSERQRTKLNGTLYQYVLKDLGIGSEKIMHIGNSFHADYLSPKKIGINSVKCATYCCHMQREYRNIFDADPLYFSALNAFINNHMIYHDEYYQFGYEVFGPLLYGFITWLYEEAKKNGIQQILFLSRDGFVMKKLYDMLGFDIDAEYFEVSRRSLRVPNYNKNMSYKEIVESLTVPNVSNIIQIFDSLGLDIHAYSQDILNCDLKIDEPLKRDKLINNEKFKRLYDIVKDEIFSNAGIEQENLIRYIKTYDFSKKTAIVDIGWGGSMQKYLLETLEKFDIPNDIQGYYVGLTLKARENLGRNHYRAQGYAFDCLNHDDEELESAYIGLIETMFFEADGSVKNYSVFGKKVVANRYPYEYQDANGLTIEAINIKKIQDGAIKFAEQFHKSGACNLINSDSRTMYAHMHVVGTEPTYLNIKEFGKFKFFNCGDCVYLANPKKILCYLLHPKQLKKDIYDSQWKIGFLKALLKIDVKYEKIFSILRKKANK